MVSFPLLLAMRTRGREEEGGKGKGKGNQADEDIMDSTTREVRFKSKFNFCAFRPGRLCLSVSKTTILGVNPSHTPVRHNTLTSPSKPSD